MADSISLSLAASKVRCWYTKVVLSFVIKEKIAVELNCFISYACFAEPVEEGAKLHCQYRSNGYQL